jgi:hypothetical protein
MLRINRLVKHLQGKRGADKTLQIQRGIVNIREFILEWERAVTKKLFFKNCTGKF